MLYTGLSLAVIAAGLLCRSGFIPLPFVVSKYGGDALWIDSIRATILGRLVSGNTFNWPDLPA